VAPVLMGIANQGLKREEIGWFIREIGGKGKKEEQPQPGGEKRGDLINAKKKGETSPLTGAIANPFAP